MSLRGICSGAGRARVIGARQLIVTAALASSMCITSIPARAEDAVMEWNRIALAATVTAGEGPNPQARSMAIVHVSVHDSVNAMTREYETYLRITQRPRMGSPEAAAIASAHYVLTHLFPSQASSLNGARAASLAARGLSDADPGIALGEAIAAAVVSRRSNDGAAQAQFPYTAPGAGTPGVWVAVGTAAPVVPGWGAVSPWVLRSGSQFRPDGPPALDSGRYARDYDEVREVGSLTSLIRTPEQTMIASFWRASPSVIWNTVARQVIEAHGLNLSARARVFALMYLATADAGIACWDAKYFYNFWRPETAIHHADDDGNDDTLSDLTWRPLFPTPQHPEYVSGHSTNSAAMATALSLLFGDDPGVLIVATSPTNAGFVRRWTTFSEGVDEVIEARIFSGMHYRTSNEVGARVGRMVAKFVVNHALRLRKSSH
jgi:hypothetical protein